MPQSGQAASCLALTATRLSPKSFVSSSLRGFKISAAGADFGWRKGRFLPRRNEGNEGLAHEVYFLRLFVVFIFLPEALAHVAFLPRRNEGTEGWRIIFRGWLGKIC